MRVRVALAAILMASLGSGPAVAQTKGAKKNKPRGAVPARKAPARPAAPTPAPATTPESSSDLESEAAPTPTPTPTKSAESFNEKPASTSDSRAPESPNDRPTVESVTPAPRSRASELTSEVLERMKPQRGSEHRYLFVAGGISGFVGIGLSYWAQGEARRANSLENAVDARRAYDGARASAASANILFAVALACVTYGVLVELWPRDSTAQPTHTLHF